MFVNQIRMRALNFALSKTRSDVFVGHVKKISSCTFACCRCFWNKVLIWYIYDQRYMYQPALILTAKWNHILASQTLKSYQKSSIFQLNLDNVSVAKRKIKTYPKSKKTKKRFFHYFTKCKGFIKSRILRSKAIHAENNRKVKELQFFF